MVVPFSAGGGTDVAARMLANKLTQKWGQSVVVDNKAGAGGIIGADFVARAKPDGYTLLIGNVGTQAINPSLYPKLPYDNDTAFTPISLVAELPIVLLTHPGFPAKNVQELIAMAKAQPGKITYASSGAGNSTHLAAEFFQAATGVKLLHVPYKGGGPATADLLAGTVDLQFTSVLETSASVKAGRLRALAVTSAQRTAALPDVPTLAEAGLRGAESGSWIALLGPKSMPPQMVSRIAADVQSVMGTAEMKQALVAQGATAIGTGPDALKKTLADDSKRYGDVIRQLGLKATN
ncbi:MAG: tripartite tricarboxylate transporter substrate binding protein [Proteobacteria bacterium]|nr:tripartite tricarboxylate transporter substrate binding protein [Pseudomonadota bacterium]